MTQDKLLDVEIITPEKVVFKNKALSVTVPGGQSSFQILFNHAPIVSTLEGGWIKLVDENNKQLLFKTAKGFTEVSNNKISILVESAEEQNLSNLN
ncbi:MAG TPA: ATP synthase F1 subunit epsilon [Candidatus Kapabacteria bacterium]|nr:ATP synthase F1 subunit epsilon [Candidatus Kapabacteria bacterium]HPO62297.1 ATP synthase F1 subunit epsilon [Candidatus Kapabacteria bacterium]